VFWCDRKTAIERDHAAIASDQTKFKVAEGRSKVAVRCDWGVIQHFHGATESVKIQKTKLHIFSQMHKIGTDKRRKIIS